MTSFTIAGNKDNIKSILSSTLLDILNETRIALNELDRDFNTSINNIKDNRTQPTINDKTINKIFMLPYNNSYNINTNKTEYSKEITKKLHKENLLNNTFHIDDEYSEEIMQKIDEAFTNSNDIEKILTQDFNQFEDILIKNNDYTTYTDKQKEMVENLKNMYIVLNNAIDSLYTTLSDDRAKRRNYLKAIKEYNKAIDSLYLKTQTDKPISNPFLDPTLNPRIND